MFKEIIIKSGQSQTAWAARLGITKSYLSSILAGKKQPGLDLAVRIQRATDGQILATSWVAEDSLTPEKDAAA
jgi:DNA-binding transcriptional regulator YdaS (Cro superfamily)